MAFELKPDFDVVMDRFEAWWQGMVIDRPLASITLPKPAGARVPVPERRHATLRDRWMDTEFVVASHVARLHNAQFIGEALPVAMPNLGPDIFAACYGCPLTFGEHTSWSEPILDDLSPASVASLALDTENEYYSKIIELTDALVAAGQGRFMVGYTDLHGGGDALAAFRAPLNLLLDTIENPDGIKAAIPHITQDFLAFYDTLYERLSAAGMPSTTWLHATCRGRFHVPSNDFSCMISDAAFEDLFIPGIIEECRHMDRNMYHLDGPQALRYLDRLLDIPEIHAIQWVPGAGHDYWADWIEVYQRIQARGKAFVTGCVPLADLPLLFNSLAPEGVWIGGIAGLKTMDEAEDVLARLKTWVGRGRVASA